MYGGFQQMLTYNFILDIPVTRGFKLVVRGLLVSDGFTAAPRKILFILNQNSTMVLKA